MKRRVLRRILNYIKTYRLRVALSVLMAAACVFLSLLIPVYIGNAVDAIVNKEEFLLKTILTLCVKILAAALLNAVCSWLMQNVNNSVTYRVIRDIRCDAFNKFTRLPLKSIDGKNKGELVSRVIMDVDTFAEGLLLGFTQFFSGILTILGTLIFMFVTNVYIALIVMCVTPLSVFAASFIARKTYSYFEEQAAKKAELTGVAEESITNLKLVNSMNVNDSFVEKFEDKNQNLTLAAGKAVFFSSITNPSTRFVNSVVYAGVGIFGALMAIKGGISVGRLSCFLSYANKYTKPFNEISEVITELQNSIACAGRVFDFLDEEEETDESDKKVFSDNVEGKVDVKDVCFSYDSNKKLIEDFNLSIKPGMKVAIVGPTGCGKTTIINLLMRFYDVDAGKIMIDCENIMDMQRQNVRRKFGMVLQETWIKGATVYENLILGKEDASLEEAVAAAKAAHAHNFIKKLPKGYDTVLSEDGGNLSQGQKQLLCIARVMLNLPEMLILDEATSSIDTSTEMKIQEAFSNMMKGRTSFIVAHRLSTIKDADVILVMNDGHIVEQGSHNELLRQGGFYAKLYNSHFEAV